MFIKYPEAAATGSDAGRLSSELSLRPLENLPVMLNMPLKSLLNVGSLLLPGTISDDKVRS